ncbi:UvrD-helicase domain-containing protein [Aeromicrobium sp. CTD01-1L150]|uniref:UvrD-helicase domain-containing protein n=1 Tax=Aeromicrobium sp. CTD01-1L150 TaxID=3341830 RepID=UPI0035BF9087
MSQHQVPRPPLVRDEDHLREIVGIPFSAAQMEAITAGLDAPSAIVAGAGSGKTTVMAARVVWLVGHRGVPPERILGLTFTNKAAAELGQRIRANLELLGVDLDAQPTASTYHAFAGQLIAEHGLRLGVETDLRIVTDASRFQRMAHAMEAFDGDLTLLSTHLPTLVGQAMALDAEMSEHLVTPHALREFTARSHKEIAQDPKQLKATTAAGQAQSRRLELLQLVEAYRAAKQTDGVMDFSDQMAAGARLAALPEVGEALRERYDVVLLDEYQDTSVAQRDLLLALFGGQPTTAVGDPAQGIYGWRGAASGNLENFVREFTADGVTGQQFSLVQTRRCAPEVIAAANDLAADFYARSEVVKPLVSAAGGRGQVDVALHHTIQDEIDAMVEQVLVQHEAGTPWGEIAVLTRVTRENAAIVEALRRRHVPFEIVGLTGLLDQPEVADVLSLLEVVEDVTANPALLRLLTGPRWNIGPRDLALLGRRAARLIDRARDDSSSPTLAEELERAVEGTDPTEIVSLADALEDPGPLDYSPQARHRFAELAGVISAVRAHVGDPLLELARRAVRALDLDVELEASDVTGGLDNLALFLDAVASYGESDRYASLSGLIAYLRAEDEYNEGLEVSTPTEADSVKLLTIHKSKGLEWDCVFVPFVSKGVFPGVRGRANWTTTADALPWPLRGDRATLPALQGWSKPDLDAFRVELRAESDLEEVRLGYVAYTRARTRLVASGHWWGRTQKKPRGPSPFLERTREHLAAQSREPLTWAEPPEDGDPNPLMVQTDGVSWPTEQPALPERRALADAVRAELEAPGRSVADQSTAGQLPLRLEGEDEIDRIAADVELLLAEAEEHGRAQRSVAVPPTVSATAMLSLTQDESAFARSLARPMPRRPSGAARFGTRFHAWVEAHYGQQPLLDPTELPGQGDVDLESDAELQEVIALFEAGPYGDLVPHAIEAPFSLVLGGQQVIGRIDAVFAAGTGSGAAKGTGARFEVVDWKTNREMTADPLQLSLYRLAWAELSGIDPARVTAAFYYVRLGQVQRFGADDLLDREALERLALGGDIG